jgi:hypothetical protein
MKPQTIAITRKFNLGNYQTMDIHVEASLNEGENPINALHELERIINDYWEGRTDRLVAKTGAK